jgi:hypothetical protein
MNKIPIAYKSLLMLFALASVPMGYADDCCNPLSNFFNCGSWNYQVRAGVYPTLWRSRGDIFLNSCDCTTNTPGVGINLGQLPKFNDFFKLPFIVGTMLGYEWSECTELYGELNFIQASPHKTPLNTQTVLNSALGIRLGHYRAVSGYVGLHYNLFDLCDASRVYLGAKLGAIYHSDIHAHQVVAVPEVSCNCDQPFKRTFFKHKIRVSGGVNLSFDYCWCDAWRLVLTGEAVVSGGPKGTCVPLINSEIVSLLGGGALGIEKIKTEVSFPVTLGLKYNF